MDNDKDYESVMEKILNQFDDKWSGAAGRDVVPAANFEADANFYDSVEDKESYERSMNSVLNQFDAKWNNDVYLEESKFNTPAVNVEPVSKKPSYVDATPKAGAASNASNGGMIGVSVAVAAIVGILFGIGSLSNNVQEAAINDKSYPVNQYSAAADKLMAIFKQSIKVSGEKGVEEAYYDSNNTLVGVMVYDPEADKEKVVIWDVKDETLTLDATSKLAVMALNKPNLLSPLDDVVTDSSGVFFVTGTTGSCMVVGTNKTLVTQLIPVDCSNNQPLEGVFSVDFSYGISTDGRNIYDKGVEFGTPAK